MASGGGDCSGGFIETTLSEYKEMKKIEHSFSFDSFSEIEELQPADRLLLEEARNATVNAYAPYSQFHVGAALKLLNEKLITGSNQENASFPAGICAERVALSAASAQFPGVPVITLAVSYDNKRGQSIHPISPCGICRQTLLEYELKLKHPIRLILGGLSGQIFILPSAKLLLPLSFSSDDMLQDP